jgi:arsenate reductase (glutaredoxin)
VDKYFPITIYHNPKCATSRNTLAMIRAVGCEPNVIEYVQVGWQMAQLKTIINSLGMPARDVMRIKGTPADELGLMGEGVTEAVILRAMIAHPVLVNRPLVVTPKGAKLCRPSELVFSLLDKAPVSFVKEDGEVVTTD